MHAIVTLTMNPAIDLSSTVDRVVPGHKLPCKPPRRNPGRGGINAAHLDRLAPGDYFALLAYVEMNETHARALQAMRLAVRDAKRVATCAEFGPRFLHCTGEAYKGGPNTGVFLQITCDDAADVPVPGRRFSFGIVKAARARGDFEVLAERGCRALRVHLGPDVAAGLATLHRGGRMGRNRRSMIARRCEGPPRASRSSPAAGASDADGPRISTADSPVSVWAVPTHEELMVARRTLGCIGHGAAR
jgi:hypothetical protein